MHSLWKRRAARLLTHFNAVAAVAPAAPNEIANLWAWYDVSDLSTLYQDTARTVAVALNNDPIGGWGDKSGNARHANQTGAATTRPTYQTGIQNGLAGALFDGGDYLDTAATLDSFPVTIIGVARTSATVGTNRGLVTLHHSTNFGSRATFTTGNLLQALVSTPQTTRNSAASFGANAALLFGYRANASEVTNIANNVLVTASHTASAVANAVSIGRTNINLTASLANGHMMEIAIYNRALSDAEIAQVSAHLNNKWAVY